jgi:hypothetical protein
MLSPLSPSALTVYSFELGRSAWLAANADADRTFMKVKGSQNRRKIRTGACTVMCLAAPAWALLARQSAAATNTWTNAGGGDFFAASNWSPAGPPAAADDALFNLADNYLVTFSGSPTNSQLLFHSGSVTYLPAASTLQTYTLSHGVLVHGGSLTSSVSLDVLSEDFDVDNDGQFRLASGGVTHAGNIGIGISGATAGFVIGGNNFGPTFSQTGATNLNLGASASATGATATLRIIDGTFSTGTGTMTINRTGLIKVEFYGSRDIFNANGDVDVNGGAINSTGTFNIAGSHSLTVQSAGAATFAGFFDPIGVAIDVRDAGSVLSVQPSNASFSFLQIDHGTQLNVSGGGAVVSHDYIAIAEGSNGSATFDGSGTSLTTGSPNEQYLGIDGGNGTLTFSNGATGNVPGGFFIGCYETGSVGTLNLQSGATLTTGRIDLANSDTTTGNINVSGGILNAGPMFIYHNGLVSVNGGTLNSKGTLTLTGGAITLTAGTFSAGSSTIINSTGTFTFNGGSASLGALSLAGTGKVVLSSGGGKVLLASSVSMATGTRIDLADNAMIVNYSGASPAATIRGYIVQGYNHGN